VAASAAEAELEHYFTMPNKPKSSGLYYKKWGTHSQQHQSTSTTLPLSELLTSQSNVNTSDRWKCNTSGSLIVRLNKIVPSYTLQVKKIKQTIQQNIILQTYINMYDHTTYNKPTHPFNSLELQHLVLREGVLKHWQMGITRRYLYHVPNQLPKHRPTQHRGTIVPYHDYRPTA
jgi:hypothetical protein